MLLDDKWTRLGQAGFFHVAERFGPFHLFDRFGRGTDGVLVQDVEWVGEEPEIVLGELPGPPPDAAQTEAVVLTDGQDGFSAVLVATEKEGVEEADTATVPESCQVSFGEFKYCRALFGELPNTIKKQQENGRLKQNSIKVKIMLLYNYAIDG